MSKGVALSPAFDLQTFLVDMVAQSSALTAILGAGDACRIYAAPAPSGAVLPYITISQATEQPSSTFDKWGSESTTRLDIWTDSRAHRNAQGLQIFGLLKSLLHGQKAIVADHDLISCSISLLLDLVDQDGVTQHTIANFFGRTQQVGALAAPTMVGAAPEYGFDYTSVTESSISGSIVPQEYQPITVQLRPLGSSVWANALEIAAGPIGVPIAFTIPGLTPGTAYDVQFAHHRDLRYSPWLTLSLFSKIAATTIAVWGTTGPERVKVRINQHAIGAPSGPGAIRVGVNRKLTGQPDENSYTGISGLSSVGLMAGVHDLPQGDPSATCGVNYTYRTVTTFLAWPAGTWAFGPAMAVIACADDPDPGNPP